MAALTRGLVQARSRTFDVESIFTLNLSDANLVQLDSILNSCADLWSLDLPSNQLSSSSLALLKAWSLPKLRMLNLACNRLDSLDGLVQAVPIGGRNSRGRDSGNNSHPVMANENGHAIWHSLQRLHVEGNNIRDVKALAGLAKVCPNLRVLHLQTLRGGRTNPVCSTPTYRKDILLLFPSLYMLDGERVSTSDEEGAASFYSTLRELEKMTVPWASDASAQIQQESERALLDAAQQANGRNSKSIPDWITVAPLDAVSVPNVLKELAPRETALRSALDECHRVLEQECDATMLQEIKTKYPEVAAAAAAADEKDGGGKRSTTLAASTSAATTAARTSHSQSKAQSKAPTRSTRNR